MEVDFLAQVLFFYKEQKWRDLLALNKKENVQLARNLLWVWPSESNLQFIKNILQQFCLAGIISIGCGCGLFEWILQEYSGKMSPSGFPVIGYEINEPWWSSRYSNPQFIKLNFPSLPPTPEILNPQYALLFCYFNSGGAFREYIECFKGDFVFIIGPGPGTGRHTDPEPFNPNFGAGEWVLYKSQEVGDTKDFIAVYSRRKH